MNKVSIIVGKHCLEVSEIIISLQSDYNLLTTDLAADDSICICPTSIQIVRLSANEMSQFGPFFQDNRSLQKIGLSESSLLFLAKCRKIKVAVIDRITQAICDELGIETIKIQRKQSDASETIIPNKDSRSSRLSVFRLASCI